MEIQRNFIPGDEWCYFKIYTGYKTADSILIDTLYPLARKLYEHQLIDQWFFIRYGDPKFHLRVRLHAKAAEYVPSVIASFNKAVKVSFQQGLIWKIQMDTYRRELERYGLPTMGLSESYFMYDSEMVIQTIDVLRNFQEDDLHWLTALKLMDQALHDFGYSLDKKYSFAQSMQESYKKEYNIDSSYTRQFAHKYRAKKKPVEQILSRANEADTRYAALFAPVLEKSGRIRPLIAQLEKEISLSGSLLTSDRFLASYIHMTLNRFFRTRQRVQETLLYDFLFRYYSSLQLREKGEKNPQPE